MGRILQPVLRIPLYHGQLVHQSTFEDFLIGLFRDLSARCCQEGDVGKTGSTLKSEDRCLAHTKPWVHVLDMSGFIPADISVKVVDRMLSVHARHEVNDGENVDIIERIRSVEIPRGVIVKKLSCFMNHSGKFIIKAPLKKQCDTQSCGSVKESGTEKCKNGEVNVESQSYENENVDSFSAENQQEVCDRKNEPADQKMEEDQQEVSRKPAVVNIETRPSISHIDTHNLKNEPALHNTAGDVQTYPNDEDRSPTTTASVNELEMEKPSCHSQVPSGDFVFLNNENEDGENAREQREIDMNTNNEELLEPLTDSTEVTDDENQKLFHVKLNLDKFFASNISVKCKGGALFIDATRECEDSDVNRCQHVHRQYQLPKHARADEASAFISEDGLLNVKIPLKGEEHDTGGSVDVN